MNKTKIEYVDYTWNPVVGCKHGCFYCYAKRIAERFKKFVWMPARFELPLLRASAINEPAIKREPAIILVCSMADLFGEWVPVEWIYHVLDGVIWSNMTHADTSTHTFLFLTKNPLRYYGIIHKFPSNCWLGYTYTGANISAVALEQFATLEYPQKFISCEPLMDNPEDILQYGKAFHWLIAGAMTGPYAKKYVPKRSWVQLLLDFAEVYRIPLFLKNNLLAIYPDLPKIQQTPWHRSIQCI
jgi:protein gp37